MPPFLDLIHLSLIFYLFSLFLISCMPSLCFSPRSHFSVSVLDLMYLFQSSISWWFCLVLSPSMDSIHALFSFLISHSLFSRSSTASGFLFNICMPFFILVFGSRDLFTLDCIVILCHFWLKLLAWNCSNYILPIFSMHNAVFLRSHALSFILPFPLFILLFSHL